MYKILLVELIEAMIKLELRDHEQSGVKGKLLLNLTRIPVGFCCRIISALVLRLNPLTSLHLRDVVCDPAIQR